MRRITEFDEDVKQVISILESYDIDVIHDADSVYQMEDGNYRAVIPIWNDVNEIPFSLEDEILSQIRKKLGGHYHYSLFGWDALNENDIINAFILYFPKESVE